MHFEKRMNIILGIIIGLIVIFSFKSGFTGFEVKEYTPTIEYSALPGENIKGELEVTTNGDGVIREVVQVYGTYASWVTLEKKEYSFAAGEENKIPYTISIPENIENGGYIISFSVVSVEDFGKKSILSSQELQKVDVLIKIEEGEEEGFEIEEFNVYNTEEGGGEGFLLTIRNLGNKEEEMDIKIIISNLDGGYVAEKNFNGKLYAYENQEIEYGFDEDLKEGEYIATTYVDVGGIRKKTGDYFNVKKTGEILKKAEIIETDINNGYAITTTANTGEGVLRVHLRGVVGENVFETEEVFLLPGRTKELEYKLDIEKAGDYNLNSELIYNNLVLDEKQTNFYVGF